MTDKILHENINIKTKLLKSRGGSLKTIVIKFMQFLYFNKFITGLLEYNQNNNFTVLDKTRAVNQVFDYICRTTDIWTRVKKNVKVFKKKILELSYINPVIFQKYTIDLGYVCCYLKRDKKICLKEIKKGRLCTKHINYQIKGVDTIQSNLPTLPKILSTIVTKYIYKYQE